MAVVDIPREQRRLQSIAEIREFSRVTESFTNSGN